MKTLRLAAPGDLRLLEEDEPIPEPGEVLLRVTAVGICGSDLHWFEQGRIGDASLSRPLILGHEFAARVAGGRFAGQPVAVDPCIPCGQCEFCLQGWPNLCPTQRFSGHGQEDGALRQVMTWPERLLFPLPDSIGPAEGAALEPLGVALYAIDQAGIRPGWTAGVFGCGPVGLLIVRLACLAGASRVFASDPLPHRRAAALAYGAGCVLEPSPDLAEAAQVVAATGGRGLDVAFEAAGNNAAVEAAIAALRPGGTLLLIGIPPDDRTSFSAAAARRKGLTILVSRRMRHTYPRAIDLVQSGKVDLLPLITHRFPLEQGTQAFTLAAQRTGLKVVIEP